MRTIDKIELSNEEALKLINNNNKRLVRHYEDTNNLWTSYSDSLNPCGCGSNCVHYEYDKNKDTIYGVCNGCNSDIYEVRLSHKELILSQGNWF